MPPEKHPNSALETGVTILCPGDPHFEEIYLQVRRKEGRIYSDAEVARLPFASKQNPHCREWRLRARSFTRFNKYLAGKGEGLRLLDLGGGNGWFSAQLAREHRHSYCCVDIILHELQQGARLFGGRSVQFIQADVFDARFSLASFDLVVLNGSIQYFGDIPRLLAGLSRLLNPRGEIHILDSPFYAAKDLEAARQRTAQYYNGLGFPGMSQWYHHHSLDELAGHHYCVLANPESWWTRVASRLRLRAGGFPWIVIRANGHNKSPGTNQHLAAS
jgi:SAM-dependent methyltransferase